MARTRKTRESTETNKTNKNEIASKYYNKNFDHYVAIFIYFYCNEKLVVVVVEEVAVVVVVAMAKQISLL